MVVSTIFFFFLSSPFSSSSSYYHFFYCFCLSDSPFCWSKLYSLISISSQTRFLSISRLEMRFSRILVFEQVGGLENGLSIVVLLSKRWISNTFLLF